MQKVLETLLYNTLQTVRQVQSFIMVLNNVCLESAKTASSGPCIKGTSSHALSFTYASSSQSHSLPCHHTVRSHSRLSYGMCPKTTWREDFLRSQEEDSIPNTIDVNHLFARGLNSNAGQRIQGVKCCSQRCLTFLTGILWAPFTWLAKPSYSG